MLKQNKVVIFSSSRCCSSNNSSGRSSPREVFLRKGIWKLYAENLQENTHVEVLFK